MDSLKFEQKCPRHPQYEIELMKIKNSDQSKQHPFFCCQHCANQIQQFNINDYISIKNLIQQDLNEILPKWLPVRNSDILNTLSRFLNNQEQLIKQIITFFQSLKQSINESIDSCKRDMIQKIQNLPNSQSYNSQILKKYQNISKINELRQHLLNKNNNIQQKENLCSIIINEQQQNIENNTKQIESLLQYKPTSLIDFKPALLIQQQIMNNIKLLSNFTKNIEQQFQQNTQIEQINEQMNQNEKIYVKLKDGQFCDNGQYNVQISTKSNYQQTVLMLQDTYHSNIVSDKILDENKNYIFRFKIRCDNQDIMIGLIQDKHQYQQEGYEDKLSFRFWKKQNKIYHSQNYGIDERLKGNDELILSEEMTLELRVNINMKILHVTDYPHYKFKFGLSYKYIENIKSYFQYRLYIGMADEGTKITLTDSFIVNEFP